MHAHLYMLQDQYIIAAAIDDPRIALQAQIDGHGKSAICLLDRVYLFMYME